MAMDAGGSKPEISVVVPALNEERNIGAAVRSITPCNNCEVIVVDGGSTDSTKQEARRAGATLISTPRGRGRQMNAGATRAQGDIILFLHADSKLPADWMPSVRNALSPENGREWGCFESISIDAGPVSSWIVRKSVALRTRLLHRPYGDQALFMRRDAFERAGRYHDDWPLLEDVALVQQLKRQNGPPAVIAQAMQTSGRRWHALGLVRTTLINQAILTGYALGVSVDKLAALYDCTGPRQKPEQ